MTHKIHTIPYGNTTQTFESHINDEQNYRTIFTGRFGSGKTSFLKEHFRDKDTYEVFHLFPVNYQVAQNEDIFELIKYDILFKFIEKDWFDDIEPISHYLAAQSFIMQKGVGHLISILKSIEYHGINKGAEVVDKLQVIFEEYQKHFQGLNKNGFDLLNDFRITKEEQKGSIYELDGITQYICNKIEEKKENDSEQKKVVLIIDDLDRIDPEHIFRLLNVFSAHFDSTDERQNKFGFDKIIFVCDIENIQKIFHHKYGADVDFNGYINKFYSKDFFEFDLSNEIIKQLDKIIDPISCRIKEYFNSSNTNYHECFRGNVILFVLCFIQVKACSLRDIEKFNNVISSFEKFEKNNQSREYFIIYIIYDFLLSMFGSLNSIKKAMNKCIDSKYHLTNSNKFSYLTTQASIFLALKGKQPNLSDIVYNYLEIDDVDIKFISQSNGTSKPVEIRYKDVLVDEPLFELAFIILRQAFEEVEKSRNTVLR